MSLFATRDIPVIYWLVAPDFKVVLFIIAALGLAFLALMAARIFRKFHVGLYSVAIVFSCAGLFLLFQGSMAHQASIALNDRVYHLALREDGQSSTYILCECDRADLLCRCHSFYKRSMFGRPYTNTLNVNTATNKLEVRAGEDVIYIDGASPQCFAIEGYCLNQ